MQPPNPAPVIREATTPGTPTAISTSASSSGELTSNRSRREAWLAANSRPSSARSPDRQGAFRGDDPGVLVDDVLGPPARDRVEPSGVALEHRRSTSRKGTTDGSTAASSATARSQSARRALYSDVAEASGASRCGRRRGRGPPATARPGDRATGNRAGSPRRPPRPPRRTGP